MSNSASQQSIVVVKNSLPLADSRVIAEKLGIDHADFYSNVITKYQEEIERDFGIIRFENGIIKGRGRPEKYALLTEDQTVVYMMYSRNTEQARACKRLLTKAFRDAREHLGQLVSPQPAPLVEMHDGKPLVDTRSMADGIGVDHRNFYYNTIVKHQDEIEVRYGPIQFVYRKDLPGGERHYALLDEYQAYAYLIAARNTEAGRTYTFRLMSEFKAIKDSESSQVVEHKQLAQPARQLDYACVTYVKRVLEKLARYDQFTGPTAGIMSGRWTVEDINLAVRELARTGFLQLEDDDWTLTDKAYGHS